MKREQTYKGENGKSEQIEITLNGKPVSGLRRHDIVQKDALTGDIKAIEVKDYRSSKVYLSEDIKREALMDIQLLKDKKVKQVEWVFKTHGDKKGEPSEPLKRFLESNGIKITIL